MRHIALSKYWRSRLALMFFFSLLQVLLVLQALFYMSDVYYFGKRST